MNIVLTRYRKEPTAIDKDGFIDITNSKLTIAEFERILNSQNFKLRIT